MHEDLAAKCKRDFEDLIAQLEERDILVQDMEVRNKFIAAHVRVQNMRHSQEQAATKHKAKARDDHVPTGKVRGPLAMAMKDQVKGVADGWERTFAYKGNH